MNTCYCMLYTLKNLNKAIMELSTVYENLDDRQSSYHKADTTFSSQDTDTQPTAAISSNMDTNSQPSQEASGDKNTQSDHTLSSGVEDRQSNRDTALFSQEDDNQPTQSATLHSQQSSLLYNTAYGHRHLEALDNFGYLQSNITSNPAYGVKPTAVGIKKKKQKVTFLNKTTCLTVMLVILCCCAAIAIGTASLILANRFSRDQRITHDYFNEKLERLKIEMDVQQQEFQAFKTLQANQTMLLTLVETLTSYSEKQTKETNSLRDELEQLRTQQETSQQELRESQTMLQSSVNTLTDRLNSSVNLYENCYEEVRVCDGNSQNNRYRRQCSTSHLPIKKPGQFTLSMHCEYGYENSNMESAYLHPDNNGNVQCVCKVTHPLEFSAGHGVLSGFYFSCALVITRCPMLQSVINST